MRTTLALIIAGCLALSTAATAQEATRRATLLQLLTAPEKFHGSRVLVFGYCRLGFESMAIYMYREDYIGGLENKLWLDIDDERTILKKRDIEYCLIEGRFNSQNHGHLGLYIGAIEEITRYERWPPKAPKRRMRD